MTWVEATWKATSVHLLCANVKIHSLVTMVNQSEPILHNQISGNHQFQYIIICTSVRMYVCTHVCMYAFMNACAYIYVCRYVCMITYRYIEKFNTVFLSFLDWKCCITEHVNVHVS